ncbi:hypothetical protein BDW62DRAFT_98967 [Aspergillus aurantiobrunneus]
METKRLKTHHKSDAISIYSTESETICSDGSESETLSNYSNPLIPHFSDRRSSPFLTLPKELRFIIYKYAFSSSSHWNELIRITVERGRSIDRPKVLSKPSSRQIKLRYTRSPALHLPVALLATNHQIYHEALPVLFSGVVFGFASNPTSLTFLLDRFSDTARNSIRYLRLYPAPLYVHDGPLGEQLSWAVLCAQVARLPSLRLVNVVYNRAKDLWLNSIESQRSRYGKPLALITAQKELEFVQQEPPAVELDQCRNRFCDIIAPSVIAET